MPHLRARPSAALAACLLLLGAPLAGQEKKVLTLDDYGRWSRVTSTNISADGRWVSYAYAPNEGDATLFLRELSGTRVDTIAVGSSPAFSDDGEWAAYYTSPVEEEAEKLREARKPVPRTLHVKALDGASTHSWEDVAGYTFSPDSRWVAVQKRPAEDAEGDGADMLVVELATGTTRHVGSVSAYAFPEERSVLAYVVDAADAAGNGAYALDPEDGRIVVLDSSPLTYERLTWSQDGTRLAVLKGEQPEDKEIRENVLLVFTDVLGWSPRTITYDPRADAGLDEGVTVSEFGNVSFSDSGERVFVGLKAQRDELEDGDDPRADVDVWHWRDETAQSIQMQRLNQLRRATHSAVFHQDGERLVTLADEDMPSVSLTADGDGRYWIGRVDGPYRGEVSWGGSRADYVRVDLETGERSPMMRGIGRTMGSSPDGRWFLFLEDERVMARDLTSGESVNLTASSGVDFIDRQDDHPYELPTHGVAGWTDDGSSVLLYDRFDLWRVPLDGGPAENLTAAMGARDQVRFRLVRLDPEEETIDLTEPQLLSAYGERTKKTGWFTLAADKAPAPLIWEDRALGSLRKAADADRVIFTRGTFVEFPDVWTSSLDFSDPVRVTDANPQQAEYAWGRRVLVGFTDRRGNKLQATLTLPAGYQEGRRYPMLVYHYELMSNRHHSYSMPTYDDRPHMSTYASDGYLVLMPDIVYTEGRPGSSALDDLTAAVQKVIDLGYADPERIGLQGHSWGGYQSSFVVTQTDMFAAVVTGAPPTNLISFYNELCKSSGSVQQGIMERGQVRMGTTPFEDFELYLSQSPLHHAGKIQTPFLILHGTEDGAVDWHQGLEYFNMAKRQGKNVILLSYPGEGHHLGRKENQKDFQVRMKQYFDHYLKGAPMPKWMAEGVDQVDKGRY
ncbi:MAG: prolyl oligopeptidase family serine peptidase [Gemmatimonadota bacterium]